MKFAIQDNQQEHMEKQHHICLCLHADIYIIPRSDAKHQRGTWSHENRATNTMKMVSSKI